MNLLFKPVKILFVLLIANCAFVDSVFSQININPLNNNMRRSRVSIDMGDGLRCTSDGGDVPVLSLSMGAYPDQIGNDIGFSADSNIYQRSGLLALASVHIPLSRTNQNFDCNYLLADAKIRARLDNLRELLDENIISEHYYRKAVLKLYQPLLPVNYDFDEDLPQDNGFTLEYNDENHVSNNSFSTFGIHEIKIQKKSPIIDSVPTVLQSLN